ncbi:uncharacterized protein LOC114752642 [Neltuma alba]|uniref:uncharacterized protein LOC114752642 n=1 Tax=Neltuma alba TaxID=207710 RepID=UPI0010A3A7DB|nr:uncharacterized protein LOC114752642 [Prosopis alba]
MVKGHNSLTSCVSACCSHPQHDNAPIDFRVPEQPSKSLFCPRSYDPASVPSMPVIACPSQMDKRQLAHHIGSVWEIPPLRTFLCPGSTSALGCYRLPTRRLRIWLLISIIRSFKKSASSAKNHLKGIEIGSGKNHNKITHNLEGGFSSGSEKSKDFSGKERVLGEAINELRSVGFWVCGIVLSAVAGDAGSYMEIRKKSCGSPGSRSVLLPVDSKIGEKLPVLKEVNEINDAVGDLLAASDSEDAAKDDAAMELQKKVDSFQKGLDDLSKEVDDMFNKVMTQRNELIDCFRFRDRSPRKKSVA